MTEIYRNKIRLDNSRAIQRLLSRTVNMLIADEMAEGKARTIGYLCNIMLNAYDSIDLDKRITAVEEKINKKVG